MTTIEIIKLIVELLDLGRFDYADEKVCQRQMEKFLSEKGIKFIREHNLRGDHGIVDFYFPTSGVALEAKAFKGWSKKRVYRQCERYCLSDEVNGLILATGKSQGLPAEIHGKPTTVYQLGRGFL